MTTTTPVVVCPKCQQKTKLYRLSYDSLAGERVALQKCLACGHNWSTPGQAVAGQDAEADDPKTGQRRFAS